MVRLAISRVFNHRKKTIIVISECHRIICQRLLVQENTGGIACAHTHDDSFMFTTHQRSS